MTAVEMVEIRHAGYDAPVVQELVTQALADLGQRYGGSGDETPVAAAEFAPPRGDFVVAFQSGTTRPGIPVGCAGWRSHGSDRSHGLVAELKRMYVVPAVRGAGVARRLLRAVEDSARAHGRTRMILECGDRQPEAVALYHGSGYTPIPHFGHYREAPGVISLARSL